MSVFPDTSRQAPPAEPVPRPGKEERRLHSIVCFSHLRWDFVWQRPQHLLSRAATDRTVIYFEEPLFGAQTPGLTTHRAGRVLRAIPHLPGGLGAAQANAELRRLLDGLLLRLDVRDFIAWYYTPMAIGFTAHMVPALTAYDCMDELANFRFAPDGLLAHEAELLARADVVFTGGHSLYRAKRGRNPNVHAVP